MRRTPRHLAAYWMLGFALSFLLWLALTTTVAADELVVGAAASAVTASAFLLVLSKVDLAFAPRLRWLRHLWRVPFHVVGDTFVVFAALIRHLTRRERLQGAFLEARLPHEKDFGRNAARHLLATMAIAATPNTYVIGFDEERQTVVLHQLVPGYPEEAKELFELR